MAGKVNIEVPSVEAVEYARSALEQVRDLLQEWEAKAKAEGDDAKADKHHWAAFILNHKLLGYDDGGCVITAFDKRWLDPNFREAMEQVRAQIEAQHG